MTKYTFLFVALLLILLPFFGLKETQREAKKETKQNKTSVQADTALTNETQTTEAKTAETNEQTHSH